MSDALNSAVRSLVSLIDAAKADSQRRFRLNMLVNATMMEIMISSGITTSDVVIETMQALREKSPEVFGGEELADGVAWAVDLFRGEAPLHGSPIERNMQMKLRGEMKPTTPNTPCEDLGN